MDMSKIFFISVFFLISGCKTQQKIVKSVEKNAIIPIRIVISIDKKNYTYQFSFINESKDTIKIVMPELDQGYSRFSKISADTALILNTCGVYSIYKIGWVELIPHKETVVKGRVDLLTYFCNFNENDLIAYRYNGAFERKDGTGGLFSFDIQPTRLKEVDSIFITKLLF